MKLLKLALPLLMMAAAAFAAGPDVTVGRPVFPAACAPSAVQDCSPAMVVTVTSDSLLPVAFELRAKYRNTDGTVSVKIFLLSAGRVGGKSIASTILAGDDIQFIELPIAKVLVYGTE